MAGSGLGWAVALDPGGAGLKLLTTPNGGATWTAATLPAPADLDAGGSVAVDFPDSAHGFVSLRRQTNGAGAGTLLRTADGGQTWQSSRLPAPGAIAFPTATNGWLSGPDTGSLYVTSDAGRTWKAVPVPRPAAYRASIAVPGLPSFLDPTTAVLPVTLAGKKSAVEFLQSTNAGKTWRIAATVPTQRPLLRPRLQPAAVVDAKTWLAALEGGQRIVTVGNGTAVPVTPRSLPFGGSKPPVAELHFASAEQGWAQVNSLCPLFHTPHCAGTQTLYATTDGGATWQRLSPP
jgi:photosystem II stability/assembly factor-like uncharacterized protein